MDEKLVEKVARAVMAGMQYPEGPDAPCSKLMPNGQWKVVGPLWRVEFADAARAAIQAMIDAGWKGPDEIKAALLAEYMEGVDAGLSDL